MCLINYSFLSSPEDAPFERGYQVMYKVPRSSTYLSMYDYDEHELFSRGLWYEAKSILTPYRTELPYPPGFHYFTSLEDARLWLSEAAISTFANSRQHFYNPCVVLAEYAPPFLVGTLRALRKDYTCYVSSKRRILATAYSTDPNNRWDYDPEKPEAKPLTGKL